MVLYLPENTELLYNTLRRAGKRLFEDRDWIFKYLQLCSFQVGTFTLYPLHCICIGPFYVAFGSRDFFIQH